MTDSTLRLPTTVFRAVLDLGPLPMVAPPLPPRFQRPDLDADWDDEHDTVQVYINFADGQLHIDVDEHEIEWHFHDGNGTLTTKSPWPKRDTTALLKWAAAFTAHLLPRLPNLLGDIGEAADWHRAGLHVYGGSHEPVPLEIVGVEIEGELLMLPWLGSGHTGHEHVDGPNHRIALFWNPEHEEPDYAIAEAWLDPDTDQPASQAADDVDWDEVGLAEAEVLGWLEGLYLNHHLIADPETLLLKAALRRMAALD